MNNHEPTENYSSSADQNNEKDLRQVNIKPSEIESDTEENAPGRTAGKAEGSREIVEDDLAEKENSAGMREIK